MQRERNIDASYGTEAHPVTPDILFKALLEYKNDNFPSCADIFSNILSPKTPKRLVEVFTPAIFRKQVTFSSTDRLKKSQLCAPQRLINLSYSQPSTPKTPAYTEVNQPSLFRSSLEAMLTTPMLIKTLDNIHQQTDNQSIYPDILQLIDDDTCSETVLDQHIEHQETNISDANLVEYVLDLSQEVKHQTPGSQQSLTANMLQPREADYQSPPRNFHRTRRKTKLMTEEERQSLQRIRNEKQKQRRKEKFRKAPRSGTRKSKRIRRHIVRYC